MIAIGTATLIGISGFLLGILAGVKIVYIGGQTEVDDLKERVRKGELCVNHDWRVYNGLIRDCKHCGSRQTLKLIQQPGMPEPILEWR